MRITTASTLRRAVTALASRAREQRRGDLTLNHVAVLGRAIVDGPLTPGEIGQQLAMGPQSLTRPLAALAKRGFVVRLPDPSDGRGALIEATAAGRLAMRAEMAPRDRWIATAVSEVCTAAEQEILEQAAHIMLKVAAYGGGPAPVEP